MQAREMHGQWRAAFDARDAAGLAALYEPDAVMMGPDGTLAEGREAIEAQYALMLSVSPRMTQTTDFAIERGDLALLRNSWTFVAEGIELAGSSAEVWRRQPDGSWLLAIDHPSGAGEPLAM